MENKNRKKPEKLREGFDRPIVGNREEFIAKFKMKMELQFGMPFEQILNMQLAELALVARMVGTDFSMDVSWGDIGGGSFFTLDDPMAEGWRRNTITLDPLILDEVESGIFVTAHEGAHRAISRSESFLGINTTDQQLSYAKSLGRAFVVNTLEDTAVNNWVGRLYSKIESVMKQTYEDQFKDEKALMSVPYIEEMMLMLGWVPRFAWYGTGILKNWHHGRFPQTADADVIAALEATAFYAEKYAETIPYLQPNSAEINDKARTRWIYFTKGIWPFVEKLIEDDKIDEKMNEFMQQELEQAMEELESENGENDDGNEDGDDDGNEENEGDGGKQSGKNANGGSGGKIKFGSGGGQKLEDFMDRYGFSDEQKKAMKERMEKAMENREKYLDKLKSDLADGKISEEEYNKKAEKLGNTPRTDFSSLPEEIKEKIKAEMDKMTPEQKAELENKATKRLEEIEDALNSEMAGKMNKKDLNHEQANELSDKMKQIQDQKQEKIDAELEEQRRRNEEYEKFEAEQEAKRNHWQRSVIRNSEYINQLFDNIEQLFRFTTRLKWQKGFPSGSRVNIKQAMQFEADPRNHAILWERLNKPTKFNYQFGLLIDQSGSTKNGLINANELDAAAIFVEVLSNLGITNAVWGYDGSNEVTNFREFKKFDEELLTSREVLEPVLSGILDLGGGTTPTFAATGVAGTLMEQNRMINKQKLSMLIVLTDGAPTDLDESRLEGLLALNNKLEYEKGITVVGVGVGSGISEENLIQGYGSQRYIYAHRVADLPLKISDLLWRVFAEKQMV